MTIELYEESVWHWDCPECGHPNEEHDEQNFVESLVCEKCSAEFEDFEIK